MVTCGFVAIVFATVGACACIARLLLPRFLLHEGPSSLRHEPRKSIQETNSAGASVV